MRRAWIWISLIVLVGFGLTGSLMAQDGASVRTIPLTSKGYTFTLSPDGHTLAVFEDMVIAGETYLPEFLPIHLVDVETGQLIGDLTGAIDHAISAVFSPDGASLITSHQNGDILLWNVADRRLERRIITVAPGYPRLASVDTNTLLVMFPGTITQIALLDIDTGYITALFAPRVPNYGAFIDSMNDINTRMVYLYAAVVVSPDGSLVAVANGNGAIDLWRLSDGESIHLKDEAEDKARLNVRSMVFTADSQRLIFFDTEDLQLHFWDIETRSEISAMPFGTRGTAYALSPDNTRLAWISRDDHTLRLFSLDDPAAVSELMSVEGSISAQPGTLTFDSTGTRLFLGGVIGSDTYENQLYVVDLK